MMENLAALEKKLKLDGLTESDKKKKLRTYFSERRSSFFEKSFVGFWGEHLYTRFNEYFSTKVDIKKVKIGAYFEFRSELRISKFKNENFLFPKVEEKNLKWASWNPHHIITKNRFGIREIANSPHFTFDEIEEDILLIVPHLTVSPSGNRLGYGGGFYDKMLASTQKKNFLKIALCPEALLIDQLPIENHDAQLDMIFTERSVIVPNNNLDYLLNKLRTAKPFPKKS